MRPVRSFALHAVFALIVAGLAGCGAAPEPTRVFVVRHAEKADASKDPELSDLGRARAHALSEAIGRAPVAAIFATPYQRTQATAAPLAAARGLPVTIVDAAAAGALADRIRAEHAGQTVLVVGHSNTVPEVVAALGGGAIAPIPEDTFDRLYLVTLTPGRPAEVLALRYGP